MTAKAKTRRGARNARAGLTAKRAGAKTKQRASAPEKWSNHVTTHSDAMDLKAGVFTLKSARAIANSLKRSSEASHRRKSSPFRSAMSMLNFEINRAGRNLSKDRARLLTQAKVELRKVFGRTP